MKKLYEVTYNNGLHSPIIIEAHNREEAIRMGLAEYRRCCTMISMFSATDVVKDAIELK